MAGLCAGAFTTPAWSEDSTEEAQSYVLRWTREPGAESCIEASSLTRYLAQVLKRDSAETEEDAMVLEGRALRAETPNRFQIKLRVLDAQGELIGERVLSTQSARCSAINSSLLLVLAMTVNPNATYEGIPAAVAEELREESERNEESPVVALIEAHQPVPTVVSSAVYLERRVVVSSAQESDRWSAFGALALSVGVVPKPSTGLVFGLRHQFSSQFSASLAAVAWLPRSVSVEGPWDLSDGIGVGATQLRAVLCQRVVQYSGFALHGCGGGQLGLRWFLASALEKHFESNRLFYGPLLGLESTVIVHRSWRIRGALNLSAQFRSDRFTYIEPTGQAQLLYKPTLLAGDAFVGVEVVL